MKLYRAECKCTVYGVMETEEMLELNLLCEEDNWCSHCLNMIMIKEEVNG